MDKYKNNFRQIQSKFVQIRKVTPVNILCEVRRKRMASPVVCQPTYSNKVAPTSEAVVRLLDGVDGVVVNQKVEVVETALGMLTLGCCKVEGL